MAKPLKVPASVVQELPRDKIVHWQPDYITKPVSYVGGDAIIPWPAGFDYCGLCWEGHEVHAILKPIS